ncbi:MAG: class I SAM-dependent methyltransferase [bacterium]|nr:class I SAM-dependent methyltransferase [bacterium]
MSFNETDLKRITHFYQSSLQEYGESDARSVHWVDTFHQMLRFEVLLHVASIDNKKILDVGCGLGDFYKFLIKKKIVVDYTGIDIIPEYIKLSQQKYPNGLFLQKDIFSISEKYDYIFASGVMSFKVENNNEFYFGMIKKMYEIADIGVAFNMLNYADHIDNETFAAYSPKEVAEYCQTFCSRVEVVTDYMPQDFTLFLYK